MRICNRRQYHISWCFDVRKAQHERRCHWRTRWVLIVLDCAFGETQLHLQSETGRNYPYPFFLRYILNWKDNYSFFGPTWHIIGERDENIYESHPGKAEIQRKTKSIVGNTLEKLDSVLIRDNFSLNIVITRYSFTISDQCLITLISRWKTIKNEIIFHSTLTKYGLKKTTTIS